MLTTGCWLPPPLRAAKAGIAERIIEYWEAHARLLFGFHETATILWIGKPATARQR